VGVWWFFQVYSEYTVGNCQVWFYVALFSFVFYTGEMAFAISSIISGPSSGKSIKQVFMTMSYHALKIIYRAFTLMVVNNFLYDVCRPVYRYLSQGSFQYKYYYHSRLGIPLPLPPRRRRTSANANPATQQISNNAVPALPIIPNAAPNYRYYSTYPQPRNKLLLNPRPPDINNSYRPLLSRNNPQQQYQQQLQHQQNRLMNSHQRLLPAPIRYPYRYPYPPYSMDNNNLLPSATTIRTWNPGMMERQRQLSSYYYQNYSNAWRNSEQWRPPSQRPPRADPTGASHVPPEAFLISIT